MSRIYSKLKVTRKIFLIKIFVKEDISIQELQKVRGLSKTCYALFIEHIKLPEFITTDYNN